MARQKARGIPDIDHEIIQSWNPNKKIYYNNNQDVKNYNVNLHLTPSQVAEYRKCKKDPKYFIKNYVKIQDLERGFVYFDLYDFQNDMLDIFHTNRMSIFNCCRQIGKTTIVAGYILHYMIFNSEKSVAIVAHQRDQAKEILERIQRAFETLPLWIQPGVRTYNKTSMRFDNGSKVLAAASGSSSVRGKSFSLLYVDEMAFIDDIETFWEATYPTVASSFTSKVIITSTPNGMGNLFHQLWLKANHRDKSQRSTFIPYQIDWTAVPRKDPDRKLSNEEYAKQWKQDQINNTSEDAFKQEYMCLFLGSTNSLINGSTLSILDSSVIPPIHSTADGFMAYEEPKPQHIYVITIDTAHGTGGDSSAFSVFDVTNKPFRHVAKYKNNQVDSTFYASIVHYYAKNYNNAWTLCETNDIGILVAKILFEALEYEYIIMTNDTHKIGIRMTSVVKNVGCVAMKNLVESNTLNIVDADTVYELSTFEKQNNSYAAALGKHDDLAMTLVIFGWLTRQNIFDEIINSDFRDNLSANYNSLLDEELSPLGFFGNAWNNDVEMPEFIKEGGELWVPMKY